MVTWQTTYLSPFNIHSFLTLPMQRLLSSKAQDCKDFWKPSKPYHVGIHWIGPAEHSQMSTHVPGFWLFFRFLHHFVLAKLATSSIKVKTALYNYLLFACQLVTNYSCNFVFHWNCMNWTWNLKWASERVSFMCVLQFVFGEALFMEAIFFTVCSSSY